MREERAVHAKPRELWPLCLYTVNNDDYKEKQFLYAFGIFQIISLMTDLLFFDPQSIFTLQT